MELGPLYRKHHTFVWQALRCLGVSDVDVDDAVQDVFVVVYRRLDTFEGRSSVRTWLYGIARRVAWKYRTRAQRNVARVTRLTELQDDADLEAATDRRRAFEVLCTFLEQLDDDRRQAFVLSEFASLRAPEIARALDVNLNTVYARLRSARTELDRTVHRLRARDSAAILRAAKRQRPEAHRAEQTWAAVAATVGLPAVALSTAGIGTVSIGWATTLVLGAGLLGDTISTVTRAQPRGAAAASSLPAEVRREAVGRAAANDHRNVEPPTDLSGVSDGRSASETASVPADGSPLRRDPAERSASAGEPAARFAGHSDVTSPDTVAAGRGGASASQPNTAGRTASSSAEEPHRASGLATTADASALAEELAAVRSIRATVEAGRSADDAIARYRATYPDGTLRIEVEALAVEMACRRNSADAVRVHEAFLRRWQDPGLASRLASMCPSPDER